MSEELSNLVNQSVENLRSQNGAQNRPQSYKPESRQVTLINALWDRMEQLFRHRWSSAEGEKFKDGQLTQNFLMLCRKTEELTNEQWRRGFDQLEKRVSDAARQGDESWPPTYAEFVGLCQEHKEQQPLTALTSDFSPVCPSAMKLSAKEKKRLRTAYRGLEDYSMNELAELDRQGIKIIGTDFDYDEFDRSWAY